MTWFFFFLIDYWYLLLSQSHQNKDGHMTSLFIFKIYAICAEGYMWLQQPWVPRWMRHVHTPVHQPASPSFIQSNFIYTAAVTAKPGRRRFKEPRAEPVGVVNS